MPTIAGHIFVNGVCECGRKRSDIRGTTLAHVGLEGIAHRGGLTETEAEQIMEADAEEARRVEEVMGWWKPPRPEPEQEPDGAFRDLAITNSLARPAPGAPLKMAEGYRTAGGHNTVGEQRRAEGWRDLGGGLWSLPVEWLDIPTSDGGVVKWMTTVDYRPVVESAACGGCGKVFRFYPDGDDGWVPDRCAECYAG